MNQSFSYYLSVLIWGESFYTQLNTYHLLLFCAFFFLVHDPLESQNYHFHLLKKIFGMLLFFLRIVFKLFIRFFFFFVDDNCLTLWRNTKFLHILFNIQCLDVVWKTAIVLFFLILAYLCQSKGPLLPNYHRLFHFQRGLADSFCFLFFAIKKDDEWSVAVETLRKHSL